MPQGAIIDELMSEGSFTQLSISTRRALTIFLTMDVDKGLLAANRIVPLAVSYPAKSDANAFNTFGLMG